MEKITILYNGKKYKYPKGVSLLEISKDFQKDFAHEILVAKVNGISSCLDEKVLQDSMVEFFDMTSKKGNRVYEKTAILILSKAIKDVTGKSLIVEHSIDKGIYCKSEGINSNILQDIKQKMDEIISKNYPIIKLTVNRLRVMDFYEKNNLHEQANILKYSTQSYITVYKLDDMYDYLYDDMAPSTSYIKDYNLEYVDENGFVLMLPIIFGEHKIDSYVHHEMFFETVMKFIKWTELMNVRNCAELNEKISLGKSDDLVFVNEANFNRNLLNIADKISANKDIKLVLIGGPSCSGKTTTSKKLELFLRGNGLVPVVLSTDDYFKERDENPVDEFGNKDYESINALDIELFNTQLRDLIDGKEVLKPTYNFLTGKKEFKSSIKLPENGILIIEGLHILNGVLTSKISKDNKYKIYISPLTSLNIDSHTRLNSTDNRLLRRMVRDNLTRGYSASETLESWDRVRLGETKYIFPYQDSADTILNTVLVYEMSVLKVYAEPLLYLVKYDDPNYEEAMRLLEILQMILPMPSDNIPRDSILREFIGNSSFE